MNTAIVLAGGSGSRMNSSIPKQYMMLNGRPVIYYSLKAFQDCSFVDHIILVTASEYIDYVKQNILGDELGKVSAVVEGGAQRYDSVWEGLKNADDTGIIFVHDGARPCVTRKIIEDCYNEAVQSGACVAAVPVKDTIKVSGDKGMAIDTPDRNTLWQVQTPQVFSADTIKSAYAKMYSSGEFDGVTDDAMVVEKYEKCGVRLVRSDYRNIKITTPEDMEIAGIFIRDIIA